MSGCCKEQQLKPEVITEVKEVTSTRYVPVSDTLTANFPIPAIPDIMTVGKMKSLLNRFAATAIMANRRLNKIKEVQDRVVEKQ